MRSLLFWKKKKAPASQGAAAAAAPSASASAAAAAKASEASEPAPDGAGSPAQLPLQRMVYAVALEDPHAADIDARPGVEHTQLLLAASREFALVGSEPRYTPRRPSLLPQLLEAINDEEASLRALSRIVAQDPQLTGDLLRTANSPLYRVSAAPVESVERATSLLGTQGIRTLIASRLVEPLASAGTGRVGRFGEVIWEYSMYSASAGEAWAARSQEADPFAVHLLALLHGLGAVTVYRVLSDLYAGSQLQPDAAAVAGALHANAAVAAARIAANWGMSERTRQALESQSAAAPLADVSPLARAVQFGLLTGAVTLLCRREQLTVHEAGQQVAAAGFDDAQAQRVWERLVRAYIRP